MNCDVKILNPGAENDGIFPIGADLPFIVGCIVSQVVTPGSEDYEKPL